MAQIIVPSRRVWTRQPPTSASSRVPFQAYGVSFGGWDKLDAFGSAKSCAITGTPTRTVLGNAIAYKFSGSSQAMLLENPAWLDLTKPFTLLASFSLQVIGYARIVTIATTTVSLQLTLQSPGSGYTLAVVHGNSGGESSRVTSNNFAVENKHYLVTVCFDGANYSMFINGGKQAGDPILNISCYAGGTLGMHLARRNDLGSYAAATISDVVFVQGVLPDLCGLSDNPWQIFAKRDRVTYIDLGAGGTTSVSADSALAYYIRSMLSSDSGITYAIRNAVYQDDAVGYALRAAIAENNAVGYVLREAIARDNAASYLMRSFTQQDDTETYSIRGLVQANDAEAYNVRGAVAEDNSALFDVLSSSSVASNSTSSYAVRGSVAEDSSPGYAVRSAAQADSALAYAVRSAVYRESASAYAIEAAIASVYADITASYAIDGVNAPSPTADQIAAAVLAALQADPSTLTVAKFLGLK